MSAKTRSTSASNQTSSARTSIIGFTCPPIPVTDQTQRLTARNRARKRATSSLRRPVRMRDRSKSGNTQRLLEFFFPAGHIPLPGAEPATGHSKKCDPGPGPRPVHTQFCGGLTFMRASAAPICDRWVSPCGKLPSISRPAREYSSANSPRSLPVATARLNILAGLLLLAGVRHAGDQPEGAREEHAFGTLRGHPRGDSAEASHPA